MAQSAASKAIGTTGRGIGPAYEDKIARRGVRVLDLRHPDAAARAASSAGDRARERAARRVRLGQARRRRRHARSCSSGSRRGCCALAEDVGLSMHRAIEVGRGDAARGRAGIAARRRSRHVSVRDVEQHDVRAAPRPASASRRRRIDAVLGVVKAYTTRVGNGPLPTELDEPLASEVRKLGNEYGATTGRARRCGWFDAVVVRYAARVNGLTDLAVTKLDVLDTLDRVAICTGYEVGGDVHEEFPGDLDAAREGRAACTSGSTAGRRRTADARTLGELPTRRARYLDRIRELVGHADLVRERRHAPRSDHRSRVMASARRQTSERAASRRPRDRRRGPVRPRRGDLGAARRLELRRVRRRLRSSSTITQYPTYVNFFSTAEKLVARRAAVRHRRRQADAPRRARVLPRGRDVLRHPGAAVRDA